MGGERRPGRAREPGPAAGWEFVTRGPCPRLRGLVLRYQGYVLEPGRPLERRELPGTAVPLVIAFDGRFGLGSAGSGEGPVAEYASFVGGVQPSFVTTRWPARVHGMQVDFTLPGLRLFLGVPMEALTGRVAELPDVLGAAGALLVERLYEAGDWAARFAVLEEAVLARVDAALEAAGGPDTSLTWAWQRIHDSGGQVDVRALAAGLGCGRQHLSRRFRQAFGVPPKALARIRRFERAARMVEEGRLPLAEVAHRTGYCDQAHLNRDFRELAGSPPGEHLLLRRAEPHGRGP